MPKGIFNPFKGPEPEKKNFIAATDPNNPYNTEYSAAPKSTIRLDGDSYVLQFDQIELEELHTRIEALLGDVLKKHEPELNAAGVYYTYKNNTSLNLPTPLAPGELRLETPNGYLTIYAGENGKEVECFRRLAYALYPLPIKDILAKHHAKVYRRG
jgi:hypothetical protein